MRTRALAIMLALCTAGTATASELDTRWAALRDRGNWQLQGFTYAPTRTGQRSQRWNCTNCGRDQDIRVGFYDFAYNYDTTNVDKVMRMVTGGCGFDACVTRSYTRLGLTGLSQTGTKRGQSAKRTVLFIEDRMLLVEIRGPHNAAKTSLLQYAAETEFLTHLLKAR